MRPVERFYDVRSPCGYRAFTPLRAMDVALALWPMQGLKVMELVGSTPTSLTRAAQDRYPRQDLAEIRPALRQGCPNPAVRQEPAHDHDR